MNRDMNIAHQLFTEPQLLEAAQAVDDGNRAKLEAVKRSGFDINQQGAKDGSTLLIWAILCRNESAVKLMLDEGADPNRVPSSTFTAIGWAASLEDPKLLLLLLSRGANPNLISYEKRPPIFDARDANRWSNVWILLDHRADVNGLDGRTGNTLGIDAIRGEGEQVLQLLQRGLNPAHLNDQGVGLAHELEWDGSNPNAPSEPCRQKVRGYLQRHGINLQVPRFGPPPRDQWPHDQKDDPMLIKAAQLADKYKQ